MSALNGKADIRAEQVVQLPAPTDLRLLGHSVSPQPIFHHCGQALERDVINIFGREPVIFPVLVACNDPTRIKVIMIIENLGGEGNEAIGIGDGATIIWSAAAEILAGITDHPYCIEPGKTGAEAAI